MGKKLNHWIVKVADQVENKAIRGNNKSKIICSSGISPSGVVHLGNLREIFSVHLIVEELKRRGLDAEHLHFWDDYDRFRKVPAGVSEDFGQYIGMPLMDVPNPFNDDSGSYGAYFKRQLEKSLGQLAIAPTMVSQSEVYRTDTYLPPVLEAFNQRLEIFDVLFEYIREDKQPEVLKTRNDYYPFKVYCESCNKDNTTISNYEKEGAKVSYSCNDCSNESTYSLNDKLSGKLVWKVDWPMRWKFYEVDYEPGGVDHSTPGSSFTIGKEIVKKLMGANPPHYVGYAFVGLTGGSSKISSSAGSIATPENALKILEPAMLRWLYTKPRINQSFNIYFDKQILGLYEEWDRLMDKYEAGTLEAKDQFTIENCIKTSTGEVSYSTKRIPFKILTSGIEVTLNNKSELLRIIKDTSGIDLTIEEFEKDYSMRYQLALNWVNEFQDEDDKLKIGESFNETYYSGLSAKAQESMELFSSKLEEHWNIDDLSTWLYAAPKDVMNHPHDEKPTPELKELQKEFFGAIYMMILGQSTGPRIPTLLISLGLARTKLLLAK